MVASTGGHLAQLHQLHRRLVAKDEPVLWIVPDTDQSRSMLRNERVKFVPYVAPRAWSVILKLVPVAWCILRRERPRAIYSTGAGIALAFLPLARLLGIETVY